MSEEPNDFSLHEIRGLFDISYGALVKPKVIHGLIFRILPFFDSRHAVTKGSEFCYCKVMTFEVVIALEWG